MMFTTMSQLLCTGCTAFPLLSMWCLFYASLALSDLILDSQDVLFAFSPSLQNHFHPFASFAKRSPSTLAYSLPFRRNASLWQGIGRNFFDLREETSQRILELLLELTTYKYGRRFVPT